MISPSENSDRLSFRCDRDSDASHVLAGNQPGAALIGQVRPQPVDRDRHTVAEADQEIDVRRTPGHPCEATGQAQPAEIDDRLAAADRRQIAEIAVAEWSGRGFASYPRGNDARDIDPLLLGDGRYTR